MAACADLDANTADLRAEVVKPLGNRVHLRLQFALAAHGALNLASQQIPTNS